MADRAITVFMHEIYKLDETILQPDLADIVTTEHL